MSRKSARRQQDGLRRETSSKALRETVMAIIRMRDHLYDEIVNYAKEHLPEEACGLLAGVETEEDPADDLV